MSHLSSKSSANIDASALLIDGTLYASSVHCSYYAVLQYMTCKLKDKLEISFEQLSVNCEKADKKSSHKYILEETVSILTKAANKFPILERNIRIRDLRMLSRNVKALKVLRIESDYKNVHIDITKSTAALKASKKIINDLNHYFI